MATVCIAGQLATACLARGCITPRYGVFPGQSKCGSRSSPPPGATHEIGAVDQAAYRDAFSLEDA
jgi:hypothetical protein